MGARSCCGAWVCRIWASPLANAHLLSSSWLLFISKREKKTLLDVVTLMRHWGKWVAECYICRISFLHGKEMYFIFHHLQSIHILKAAGVCGSLSTKQGRNLFYRTNPRPHPFSCRRGWKPHHKALSQASRSKSECHSMLSDDSTRFTLIRALH